MDARFHQHNPLRYPHWRAERAVYLADRCSKGLRPGAYDDHCVRVYRRYLVDLYSAGQNDELRESVHREFQHIHRAHQLRLHPDGAIRQLLEAWLLTTEPCEGIARRFGIEVAAVEYFEQIFLMLATG
jgi:hypothetical protein